MGKPPKTRVIERTSPEKRQALREINIVLHWVRIETEAGVAHRVGQYTLTPKGAV